MSAIEVVSLSILEAPEAEIRAIVLHCSPGVSPFERNSRTHKRNPGLVSFFELRSIPVGADFDFSVRTCTFPGTLEQTANQHFGMLLTLYPG